MRIKGICPVCGEVVDCGRLHIARSTKKYVVRPCDTKDAEYLCTEHPAQPRGKTGKAVSATTGEVLRTFCDGTHRPPGKLFTVH